MTPIDWDNYEPLTREEKLICSPLTHGITNKYDSEVNKEFLEHLRGQINYDAHVRVMPSATQIIHNIFEFYRTQYEGKNTLVITTGFEHPNVTIETLKCRQHIIVRQGTKIPDSMLEGKDHILVYLISTSYDGTKELNINYWVRDLKEQIKNLGVNATFILDDVQGMFLLQRDYTLFDYVIGTAHSLVLPINLGFCINNNKDNLFGVDCAESLRDFLCALDVVMHREAKMLMFNYVVKHFFLDMPEVEFLPTNPYRCAFTIPKPIIRIEQYLKSQFSDLGDVYFCNDIKDTADHKQRIMTRSYSYISGFPLSLNDNLQLLKKTIITNKELTDGWIF